MWKSIVFTFILAFSFSGFANTIEVTEELKPQRLSKYIFFGKVDKDFGLYLGATVSCAINFYSKQKTEILYRGSRFRISQFIPSRSYEINPDVYVNIMQATIYGENNLQYIQCQKIGDRSDYPSLEEIERASEGKIRFY
ncbi:MAG: hypothetical protein CME62_09535 [Halobacteriovoraceae bacterium]|nr:hypothetical protein [Halobacteriovoraceae bacterium]|tara:strand:- start:4811 stop:5227 length:417 start_codon:yes stop_codon:yes gene_type:complete